MQRAWLLASALAALAQVGCEGVPDLRFGVADTGTDSTVALPDAGGADDAQGPNDAGGSPEAGGVDAATDAGSTCQLPTGAMQCCGAVPCFGDCGHGNYCRQCQNQCDAGTICCAKGGVTCQDLGTTCPP
jgi:hypothetical protein